MCRPGVLTCSGLALALWAAMHAGEAGMSWISAVACGLALGFYWEAKHLQKPRNAEHRDSRAAGCQEAVRRLPNQS